MLFKNWYIAKYLKFFCSLMILPFITVCLQAQTQTIYKGQIISKNDKKPISYATITFISQNLTTISNAEGEFNLAETNGRDSILVSAIGFRTTKFPQNDSKNKKFELPESMISLNEVSIKPLNAVSILKNALVKSDSSISNEQILTGYYKEYVKRDDLITKYADGIISYYVEKQDEDELKVDLKVNQSRAKSLPIAKEDDKYDAYSSFITIKDQVKLIRIKNLQPFRNENFRYYNYLISEVEDNGTPLYIIYFKPKAGNPNSLFQGRVTIDQNRSLIMSVEYSVADESKEYLKSISLLGIKASLKANTLHLIFSNSSNGYGLSYASRIFDMEIKSNIYNQLNSFKSEFLVNSVQRLNVKPFKTDTYNKRNLFKRGTNYQTEYWKEPNVIMDTKEESTFLR